MYWYDIGFKCVCKCMAQSIEYVATANCFMSGHPGFESYCVRFFLLFIF